MRGTLATLPLLFVACSVDSPEPTHTSFVECEDIAVACHNVDLAQDGGIGEDCHAVGHLARTAAPCQREHAVCLAYCSGDAGFDANDWAESGSRIIQAFLEAGAAEAGDAADGSDQ
jgi:hypothetical protein